MSRPPDFDELVEGVAAEDRERLRRVHDALLRAGPPPELSPALASVEPPRERLRRPRRRLALGLAFAAALLAATFGGGYLAGRASDDDSMAVRTTLELTGEGEAAGVVHVGFADEVGNWPMRLVVRGLEPLRGGDYYRLALTRNGEPVVTCGTFNVSGEETTVELSVAYRLAGFDGWVVTLWDRETRDEERVLWTSEEDYGALRPEATNAS